MSIDAMNDRQKAAVSALQRSLTEVNAALARAAAEGVAVSIDTIDITTMESPARAYQLAASVGLPPVNI